MRRWEYMIQRGQGFLERDLNRLGAQGWELCMGYVDHDRYGTQWVASFKREVDEP